MSTKLNLSDHEREDWHQIGAGGRQVSLSDDEVQAILSADLPGPVVESLRSKLAPLQARDRDIVTLAKRLGRDGEMEVDDSAIVSEGDDNGAYVSSWKWVSFEGTALDKDLEADEEDTPSVPALI